MAGSRVLVWTVSCVLVLSTGAATAGVPEYEVRDLGPGRANAINSGGAVVGWYAGRAVCWGNYWDGGAPLDLGTLGGLTSEAYDINDLDQIVGWSDTSTTGEQVHAFVWTAAEGMVDLTPTSEDDSRAYGINNGGGVVGWYAGRAVCYGSYWDGSEPNDLGDLGGATGEAYGINDVSQIVGWSETAIGQQHAFAWSDAEGIIDLEPSSPDNSRAHGVNGGGAVVGWAAGRAVFWGSYWDAGTHSDLGDLGGPEAHAYAINASGQVVGYSQTATLDQHAFIWSESQGMRDLNELIPDGSPCVLEVAHDINEAGSIVGWGIHLEDPNEPQHAFLLVRVPGPVPAVPPWGLIAMASVTLVAGLLAFTRKRAAARWRRAT